MSRHLINLPFATNVIAGFSHFADIIIIIIIINIFNVA